jgi:hypothetical protein
MSYFLYGKGKVVAGSYYQPTQQTPDLPATCSSGECAFPVFTGLGVCSKVANISHLVKVEQVPDQPWPIPGLASNATYNASISQIGLSLVSPNLQVLTFATPNNPSISFQAPLERATSLLDVYMLYSNPAFSDTEQIRYEALEMMIYICVKEFTISVNKTQSFSTTREATMELVENKVDSGSFNIQWNTRFDHCFFDPIASCDKEVWSNMTLASGDHRFVLDELAGQYLSKLLWTSFDPRGSELLGNFMKNFGWRILTFAGDLAFGFGIGLWRDPFRPSDAAEQLQITKNMTENVAKTVENM